MLKNRHAGFIMAIALGVISGAFRVVAAESATDFTYQSLTNLGPCASSRVLLMNNDTNETCPIHVSDVQVINDDHASSPPAA